MVHARFRYLAAPLLIAALAPAGAAAGEPASAGTCEVRALQPRECARVPAADEDRPDTRTAVPSGDSDPFRRNAIGVGFNLALLGEAWNLNEGREWLAGGSVAMWWAFRESLRLVGEVHLARVFQERPRNAFVQGFTPLLRWRVRDRPPWGWFVEFGPGISWSDTRVPPRGTRFNYLLLGGTGLSRRVGGPVQAVASFRWLHLSNGGREGRDRNPDIEALGAYTGLAVAF